MKTSTKQILNIMNVISWIIFVGLCIEAGAIIVSFLVSMFVNPGAAADLHVRQDLSGLYDYGVLHYIIIVMMIILMTVLKAIIFYLVIKIFQKLSLVNPFSSAIAFHLKLISYVALVTGIFAMAANGYTEWLIGKGVSMQKDWAATEWLFMAGIIFIISLVFIRGVELQSENELTI